MYIFLFVPSRTESVTWVPNARACLEHLAARGRSAKTLQAYRAACERLERFLLSRGDSLATAPPSTLAAFGETLTREGLAPASVALYVTAASCWVEWCRRQGMRTAPMPRPMLVRARPLAHPAHEQVRAAYEHIERSVPEPYCTALLMRALLDVQVGELCALRLEDITIAPPLLALAIRGTSARTLEVSQAAAPILARYLAHTRPSLPGDDYLFPNTHGRPISQRMLQRHLRTVRTALDMVDIRPNTLRQGYALLAERAHAPASA